MRLNFCKSLALLMAFALVLVAAFAPHSAAALEDTPAPEATATATPTVAPTVAPTDAPTAVPTETPEPTDTPEPTLTAAPTDSAKPTDTPAPSETPLADDSKKEDKKEEDKENEDAAQATATPEPEEEPEVVITVEPEDTEAILISVNGSVSWVDVPDGAAPRVTLSLSGGDGVSRAPVALTYGGETAYAFSDLPTAVSGYTFPAYKVSARAGHIPGYNCTVAFSRYDVTITYQQKTEDTLDEDAADTEEKTEPLAEETTGEVQSPITAAGSVTWVDVPEGATPGVEITLGGGDGVARTPVRCTYGGTTEYAFENLPSKDSELNDYPMYTIAAAADAIEGYECSAVCDGFAVTVTYIPAQAEETLAAVQSVIDAIAAYPSVETVGNMDPTGDEYAAAIRDYNSIMDMIAAIPEDARVTITNLSVIEDATLKQYILGA